MGKKKRKGAGNAPKLEGLKGAPALSAAHTAAAEPEKIIETQPFGVYLAQALEKRADRVIDTKDNDRFAIANALRDYAAEFRDERRDHGFIRAYLESEVRKGFQGIQIAVMNNHINKAYAAAEKAAGGPKTYSGQPIKGHDGQS